MSSNSTTADASAETPKTTKSPSKARRKSASDHPKISEMVNEALGTLKESNGSSLRAIKKYIADNFPVEIEKLAPYLRRYLKSQVTNGSIIQTKGKGASGSFKLRGISTPTTPRKRPSAAVRAAAAAAPRPVKAKAEKAPKRVSKEKTKRSPKKAKTPKPKKAGKKAKKRSTPKQETAA